MRRVVFLDTSVLCNIVPVPGRDQDASKVKEDMRARLEVKENLVLPITSVIETGNFIAQIKDGGTRGQTAEKFCEILRLVCDGKSPWILHDVQWDRDFLEQLLGGAGTGMSYVEHARNRLGTGDLCILAECRSFAKRTGCQVEVWTLDTGLAAYAGTVQGC